MNSSLSPGSNFLKRNKHALLFVVVVAALSLSCQPAKQKSASTNTFMLDTVINGKKLMIKDTTVYSPEFIRQLKQAASVNESIKLTGDSIVVSSKMFNGKKDTVVTFADLIPTVLKLNELYRFTSSDSSRNYTLTLKRNNFTNIEYLLELDGKAIQQGTALLQSSFYLAKEVSDDENGEQLFLDQYIYNGAHWAVLKVETREGKTAIFESTDDEVKKLGEIPLLQRN